MVVYGAFLGCFGANRLKSLVAGLMVKLVLWYSRRVIV
jgi:hypothetical protein